MLLTLTVGELVVEPAALVQPSRTAKTYPKKKYSTGFGLGRDRAILTTLSAESTGRISKTVVYSGGMRL
jgi:hypothetical protein